MQLITGGCSFSDLLFFDKERTWPYWVEQKLQPDSVHHVGFSSQGNGLISRRVLYTVQRNLKEDTLVCIMWSGPTRAEYYVDNNFNEQEGNWGSGGRQIKYIDSSPGIWAIMNHSWTKYNSPPPFSHPDELVDKCIAHYTHFYDPIFDALKTFEHIIRTQHYLQVNNIPYVFMTYTEEVFNHSDHVECKWLLEQLDTDAVIPESCFEWSLNESNLPMRETYHTRGDNHPTEAQYKAYCEQVIIPHMQRRNLL